MNVGPTVVRRADLPGSCARDLEPRTEELIVKLPRERVGELIAAGEGRPFSPAGKTFKEWVAVVGADRERWSALLAEAQRFGEGGYSSLTA